MRHPRALVLIVAAWIFPSFVLAGASGLIPRPFENGVYLDLFASHERDDNRYSARSLAWSDTFFKEKITLYSNGYFYHPRFLQYQLSVAGALKQESYDANFLDSPVRSTGSGVEYDGKLLLLPEHPYNLELFARRYEPLFKEQLSTQHDSVETGRGAFFRYRKKPYFFHARSSADTIESGAVTSRVGRLGLGGEYFKRYRTGNQLSLSADSSRSRFSSSAGLDGTSTESLASALVDLRRVRLNSSVSKNRFEQEGAASPGFESDRTAWYELLTAYLPLHFRSDVSYRRQDSRSTIRGSGQLHDRALSDLSEDFGVDIVHRLYESLDTTYAYLHDERTSSGGDSTSISHSLALNYTKRIPRGRILAGVNRGRTRTDDRGRTDVVDEPHAATPVPGSFLLDQQNADAVSIAVFLRSPVAPFEVLLLEQGIHYAVTPFANTLEILVVALPPLFLVPGTYDFFVSYSLPTGNFVLRSETVGYSASVALFDDLLTPYASYLAVGSEILSGTFPGIPVDSTTRTAGLLVHSGPLRVRGEYQRFDWDVNPYRLFRVELQSVGSLSPTTSMYATASYSDKYFPRGASVALGTPYTERTAAASASVRKQLLGPGLLLSAGGTYSHLVGLVDSTAYSMNSSLIWRIGKLDMTFGASAYRSATESTITVPNRRTHQYYYVRLRRELF